MKGNGAEKFNKCRDDGQMRWVMNGIKIKFINYELRNSLFHYSAQTYINYIAFTKTYSDVYYRKINSLIVT